MSTAVDSDEEMKDVSQVRENEQETTETHQEGVDEIEEEEEEEFDTEKIKLLPGSTEDGTAASFQIVDEDHTLGNALRYIIMKNPDVEFCGYSIPHPSETKLNIRIQTYGPTTAVQALHKGLDDLVDLCNNVESVFRDKLAANDFSQVEP